MPHMSETPAFGHAFALPRPPANRECTCSDRLQVDSLMRNRLLLSGLAGAGALETGWLAFAKSFTVDGHVPFCEGNGCSAVLSSAFSKLPFIDVPLVNVGFVSYTMVALLATATLAAPNTNSKIKEHPLDALLLFATTAMCTYSAYLLAVMIFIVKEPCALCLLSALISTSLAGVSWATLDLGQNQQKSLSTKLSAVLSSLVVAGTVFTTTTLENHNAAGTGLLTGSPASTGVVTSMERVGMETQGITQASTPRTLALADRLAQLGAKMYGTYWCSHCHHQKQVLGADAYKVIEYVECDKEGAGSQYQLCREKQIPGYPTWEIAGKLYPGEKTVEELEAIVDKAR